MRTYFNVFPSRLYDSCLNDVPSNLKDEKKCAYAWIEAENIYAVWEIVQKWFELLEGGQTNNIFPDPFWKHSNYPKKKKLTQEVANNFIKELEADLEIETRYNSSLSSGFDRLSSHARLAFVQAIYQVMKTSEEILEEVEIRLANGEKLPPFDAGKYYNTQSYNYSFG